MRTSRSRSFGSDWSQTYSGQYTRKSSKCLYDAPTNKFYWVPLPDQTIVSVNGVAGMTDKSTISDVVGGRGFFNPCVHTRDYLYPLNSLKGVIKTEALPPAQYGWYDRTLITDSRVEPLRGIDSISFKRQLTNGQFPAVSFPSIDWADLTYQVGSQLDGQMTTGQNLLVSLSQLAQVVGMVKNPFSLTKLPKILRSKSLSQISKVASSGYLEYQFGWRPLWNDIKALASVYDEVSAHQQYLKNSTNRFVSLASRQVDEVTNPSAGFDSLGAYSNSVELMPRLTSAKRTACFSLDIYRDESMACWSRLDQTLARLGTRDIGLALWDLVPFSFVVDWFTHVNRIIEQKPIVWNQFKTRYIGYSTKLEYLGALRVRSYTTTYSGGTMLEYSTDPRVVRSTYERIEGFPPLCSSVGLFGDLNMTQLAEGAALIIQRM